MRIRIFNFMLFTISLIYFGYLFYIQCIQHELYAQKAKNQHERKFVLIGERGNIYDRNGLPIAISQPAFSIFCTPRYVKSRERVAKEAGRIAHISPAKIKELMRNRDFFWLERKVDLTRRDRYLKIDDPGIGFTYDLKRQYNLPEVVTSLLGRCGTDNRGIEGIELQLDDLLSGKSGFVIYERDPLGKTFPYHYYSEIKPKPGADVYLTIDLQLETTLYTTLKKYLLTEDANYASGVIIQPTTGEVLALVNVDRTNGNRNHVICDEFEPGSTLKLLTLAYVLLNGFQETDIIDANGGEVTLRGHKIRDPKDYGIITLREAIVHSSNVAMAKLSKSFDRKKFYLLLRDFGLGTRTGIELPGEVAGRFPKIEDMNELEFAIMSFGQGITTNLLQLGFMYQAIANRGILNKPIIVKEIHENKRVIYQSSPLRIRRVVPEDVARRVTNVLCGVVESGSGVQAGLSGIKIAGKTGTAQKVVDGKYSKTQVITTFVGYFPAHSPDYLIAVLIDEPKANGWASNVAAPLFRDIAQSIYQMNLHQYAVK